MERAVNISLHSAPVLFGCWSGLAEMTEESFQWLTKSTASVSFSRKTFNKLQKLYSNRGCSFEVICEVRSRKPIAAVGFKPFHGLSYQEKIGEISDFYIRAVRPEVRLVNKLIDRCLNTAHLLGYRRLYLKETEIGRVNLACFIKVGFRPVVEKYKDLSLLRKRQADPCYYVLDKL